MTNDITKILNKLNIEDTGRYEDHFYIINLTDSDAYAQMYSLLCEVAINTEYPNFGTNTNKSTVKVTNYFEIEDQNILYNIFLIADFDEDKYYLKIKENVA